MQSISNSILMPDLRDKVIKAISSSRLDPNLRDLSQEFWQRVGEGLSDSRTHYVVGSGHREPSVEELKGMIGKLVDEERKLSRSEQT